MEADDDAGGWEVAPVLVHSTATAVVETGQQGSVEAAGVSYDSYKTTENSLLPIHLLMPLSLSLSSHPCLGFLMSFSSLS